MWYPALITAPASGEVITLDDAKAYLRVDGDCEDEVVAGALAAAVAHIEAYTGTRLLTQTAQARCGSFVDFAHLPFGPVQSVSTIAYLDAAGALQTLDASQYELFGSGLDCGIRPALNVRWPSIRRVEDAITVTMVVGYGVQDDIPAPVSQAILLLLGDLYANREDTVTSRATIASLPHGVASLLGNFRINA